MHINIKHDFYITLHFGVTCILERENLVCQGRTTDSSEDDLN